MFKNIFSHFTLKEVMRKAVKIYRISNGTNTSKTKIKKIKNKKRFFFQILPPSWFGATKLSGCNLHFTQRQFVPF